MCPPIKILAMLLISASTLFLQGCFTLAASGIGAAALMVDDRRSTGVYVEDENVEWKARGRILDRFKDAHVNVTSYNLTICSTPPISPPSAMMLITRNTKPMSTKTQIKPAAPARMAPLFC